MRILEVPRGGRRASPCKVNHRWSGESDKSCLCGLELTSLIPHEGISEVKTNVKVTPGEDRNPVAVFSCSATGKPAPTIQWDSSPAANDLDQSETSIVMNSDGTFTSSSNITLQVSPDWKEQVHCLLNTGVNGQRKELIPLVPDTGHEEEEQGMYFKGAVCRIRFREKLQILANRNDLYCLEMQSGKKK